jgi:hypothetical protein
MNRVFLAIALAALMQAADDPKAEIKKIIAGNLKAMQAARTQDDILRAIEAMDAPDWVSEFNGQTWTRADALRELQGMLTIPPEKRGTPKIDFIYWTETPAHVTALFWVYGERDGAVVGSLSRDTWVHTSNGWRRTRHEKYFPDRPLIANGKPVILPPLADQIR